MRSSCLAGLAAGALLFMTCAAAADKSLHGRWIGQGEYQGMELVFNADGSGSFDGEALMYQTEGGKLQVLLDGEFSGYSYQVKKSELVLTGADGALRFLRPNAKTAAGAKSAPKGGGSDELSKLLLSSAWCSFSFKGGGGGYNSGGSYGRSNSSRVQFFADGSYSASSQSDSYSSNSYGSVAGQGSQGNAGRWAVQAGRLAMSEGGGPLRSVVLNVTRNSNGYPILNADGTEYSQCN